MQAITSCFQGKDQSVVNTTRDRGIKVIHVEKIFRLELLCN